MGRALQPYKKIKKNPTDNRGLHYADSQTISIFYESYVDLWIPPTVMRSQTHKNTVINTIC